MTPCLCYPPRVLVWTDSTPGTAPSLSSHHHHHPNPQHSLYAVAARTRVTLHKEHPGLSPPPHRNRRTVALFTSSMPPSHTLLCAQCGAITQQSSRHLEITLSVSCLNLCLKLSFGLCCQTCCRAALLFRTTRRTQPWQKVSSFVWRSRCIWSSFADARAVTHVAFGLPLCCLRTPEPAHTRNTHMVDCYTALNTLNVVLPWRSGRHGSCTDGSLVARRATFCVLCLFAGIPRRVPPTHCQRQTGRVVRDPRCRQYGRLQKAGSFL